MNGHDFGLWRLSHRKHFALWFLDEVFCSVFETASFRCLNSFWIADACFIVDSRDSEKSMAFIPHTKRSLNIESKESPYSQYWLSLLSSAMYCDTLSPLFLLRMLNWDLSAIRFLFGFSWFVIEVTNSSNNFYKGFAGAVSPLNNRYVSTPKDFKRKALFFCASAISFAVKNSSRRSTQLCQSSLLLS